MTALATIETLFGKEHSWVSPWVESLPSSYFHDLSKVLTEWHPQTYNFNTPGGRFNIEGQTFIRLSQAHENFIPWVREVLPFVGERVLEIGSGTGSSTAALLMAGADVLGLEIVGETARIAEQRCEMLSISRKPIFAEINPNWLKSDEGYDWDAVARDFRPTSVVCYALIEHLTPAERIVLIYNALRILPIGGHLITFETPNRLMVSDWHSSKLLFSEVLPDWLLRRYLTMSPRENTPALARKTLSEDAENDSLLYRWGRGASFHEFQLAAGFESFQVVQDGYAASIVGSPNRRPVDDFERALRRIFAEQIPPIPNGFARTSLDLIIKKVDQPIRFDQR